MRSYLSVFLWAKPTRIDFLHCTLTTTELYWFKLRVVSLKSASLLETFLYGKAKLWQAWLHILLLRLCTQAPPLHKGVRRVCEKCSHGFSSYSGSERCLIRNSMLCSLFWWVSKLFTPKGWFQDIWFSCVFHAYIFLCKLDDFYVEVLDSTIKGVEP